MCTEPNKPDSSEEILEFGKNQRGEDLRGLAAHLSFIRTPGTQDCLSVPVWSWQGPTSGCGTFLPEGALCSGCFLSQRTRKLPL